MKYRPDIDGLRAIAISFVLFFHGGLSIFPSGFIGVDIFFVISGYLISTIIHDSLQNKQFSFTEFYGRRLWRLQPVLLCMIAITAVLTLIFYLPHDFKYFFKSARSLSLFMSNHYFDQITVGYFAEDSSQLPLLHTWSLSIEWQCYLILPIVIYLLHRIFAKQNLVKLIYLLTALFFALALYFSLEYPAHTYYQFPSRIFEFLIGSSVALSSLRFSLNKYLINLITFVAVLALFYIATRVDIKLGFPNWYALALCLATGLLIAVGEHEPKPFFTRLLATKPIVFIGLISYSLYIWHWPLFALLRYLNIEETSSVLFLTFGLIFVLAYLSWRFIEKPARQFNTMKFGYSLVLLLVIPSLALHVGTYFIKKNKGYPQRFAKFLTIYGQLNQYQNKQRALCIQNKNIEINSNCLLGSKNSNSQTGFMIGDSFSNHSWGFMDTLGKEANLSILAHATESCLVLPGLAQYDWSGYSVNKIYQECYEQTARYYGMIKANHYDYVIIGQNWSGYFNNAKIINQLGDERTEELSRQRIADALDKALQIIIDSGAKPVLIKSTVLPEKNLYHCLFDPIKRRAKYRPQQCDFDNSQTKEEQWFNDLLAKLELKYAQLIVIDPRKVQCPEGRCMATINGVPVFRDAAHITDYASYQLAKFYLQQYKNPLIT